MKIRIKLFATYREIVKRQEIEIEMPEGATAAQALAAVVGNYPSLSSVARVSRVVVNQAYAEPHTVLQEGDEVVFLPPVSGGDRFIVTPEALNPASLIPEVWDETAGAIVIFVGVARRFSKGKRVEYLEYEAYKEMAEKELARIGEEIREKWGLEGVALHHRVGRLQIGEASVAIAVAAPHRAEAFEACRYAIDRLKTTVPIWKKEVWEDGEVWVGIEGG